MQRKKVLILGATGMAGHIAYYFLKSTNKYEVLNAVFRNKLTEDSIVLDVTNPSDVEQVIVSVNPDIIINCIGVLIKGSKEHPDNAIYINAYFPHLLKRIADACSAKLIHISTDCVFSGKKGQYTETDFPDADDVYGRSKALGEINNNKDLTIRTSIIGPELKSNGEGLFHWFMLQTGDINGYTNAFWGGVTTLELAKALDFVIENKVTGLIHLTNGDRISKFDLLNKFNDIWGKGLIVNPYKGKDVDKSLVKSQILHFSVSSYEQMLLEQFDWMIEYSLKYNSIYGDLNTENINQSNLRQ